MSNLATRQTLERINEQLGDTLVPIDELIFRLGGFYDTKEGTEQVSLAVGEEAVIIVPFGYSQVDCLYTYPYGVSNTLHFSIVGPNSFTVRRLTDTSMEIKGQVYQTHTFPSLRFTFS